MIAPPKLRPGDPVAIIAPAGAHSDEASLEGAMENLRKIGLEPIPSPNLRARWGYLAGQDQERADDFNWAVANPDIRGIICLRGGYGTMRMLPMIDYAAFRANPKVVMGYSDITGILNALTTRSGVMTFHGPIAEAKFEGYEGEWMRKAIFSSEVIEAFLPPTTLRGRAVDPSPRTIQSGRAEGRLIGGNLSLIQPCAGTPYGPKFEGAILVLEDINEDPYRVDRMLTSLWLGGHLQKLAGIVLADFRPPKPRPDDEPGSPEKAFNMDQVFDHLCQWVSCPIFCGLYAGHISDKVTLPIGARARMDADALQLEVLEPCVV